MNRCIPLFDFSASQLILLASKSTEDASDDRQEIHEQQNQYAHM